VGNRPLTGGGVAPAPTLDPPLGQTSPKFFVHVAYDRNPW